MRISDFQVNEWNGSALILSAFENRLITHHANPAVEQNNGPTVRGTGISPIGEEKFYTLGSKEFAEEPSSEWKTDQVREDKSGDSEDGEDDEMPCVRD